jgi:hypothetical protein
MNDKLFEIIENMLWKQLFKMNSRGDAIKYFMITLKDSLG